MAQRSDPPPTTTEEVSPPEGVTAPEALSLAAGFPQADRGQWQELVAGVLRRSGSGVASGPAEDSLRTSVGSGIEIAPLYVAEDAADLPKQVGVPGLAPFVRGRRAGLPEHTGWDVRARHAHPDVEVTRQAIAADLHNGVTSLWLVLGPGAIPAQALPEVLDGVLLDVAPVVLQAGSATLQVADCYFELAASQGVKAGELLGNLGADPYGDAIRTDSDLDVSVAVSLACRCHDNFPHLRAIVVDSTVFHDAGAGVVEELGCSLAAGVGYLRLLTDEGMDVDSALAALEFRYSAGADQFLTIATLRAARRLWNRVGEVSGASASVRGQRQHAVTSSVMMTRRDPWVNMLRTTVACFAAGVGGADAVTVAPFDSEIGLPDSFARRIARNTQTLLMEEGHLARVLDPAGGSWYVESLTDQLATAAWEWFTEIERAGGLAEAMSSGLLTDRIASVWAVRRDHLAHRSDPITGVSEFPNLTETLPEREPHPPVEPGSRQAALPVVRAAGDFETLRDQVDVIAAERDSRPAVFLATLGSVDASTPRASFAANLFQAAGLDTPSNGADGGENAAIVSAFARAATSVVCLCGTDQLYADRGAALADALVAAGATQVWLAGSPSTSGDVAGIDGHVFAGIDALEVLGRVLGELVSAEGDEPS
ncbi:MAG: methylmalonyl-CoA mutase [Geodermatophilaceae bacterium]|nr:methylmalonyl-CoA mutase [Geodermatophilaceae bacterium]